MAVRLNKTKLGIHFQFFGNILTEITKWRKDMDKLVFDEQIATGSYHGKYFVSGQWLELMKHNAGKGAIMPYYGCDAGSGFCYQLRPAQQKCMVMNSLAKDKLSISERLINKTNNTKNGNSWVFRIEDEEYLKLNRWDNWDEKDALSGRYNYKFCAVSLGKGFHFEVSDSHTNTNIDITDYDCW